MAILCEQLESWKGGTTVLFTGKGGNEEWKVQTFHNYLPNGTTFTVY